MHYLCILAVLACFTSSAASAQVPAPLFNMTETAFQEALSLQPRSEEHAQMMLDAFRAVEEDRIEEALQMFSALSPARRVRVSETISNASQAQLYLERPEWRGRLLYAAISVEIAEQNLVLFFDEGIGRLFPNMAYRNPTLQFGRPDAQSVDVSRHLRFVVGPFPQTRSVYDEERLSDLLELYGRALDLANRVVAAASPRDLSLFDYDGVIESIQTNIGFLEDALSEVE